MRLSLGYPSLDDEAKMLTRLKKSHPIDELTPVATAAEMVACQEAVRDVAVDDKVRDYALKLVHASRQHEDVALGGSPRASIALYRTAQALAALQGRDFALPDDVKKMAIPVLAHRIILKPESRLRKLTPTNVVQEIVSDVSVPVMPQPGVRDDWGD
ncbi:MAG: MoxR family ATPase [Gemmataceae bacterium]